MGVDQRQVPTYAGWADSMVVIAELVCLPIVSGVVESSSDVELGLTE